MTERERRAGFLICLAGYCDVAIEVVDDGLVLWLPPGVAEENGEWWEANVAEFGDEIHKILTEAAAPDAGPQRVH